MATRGASVVAFDYSAEFIARARERTPSDAAVEYHVVDVANAEAVVLPGSRRFNKAVCTMALMDMPEIRPLFKLVSRALTPGGAFVFAVTHPCFHSAAVQRFTEVSDDSGRHVIRSGVKVSSYLSPFARKTEGIVGQPEPQWFFHRPISVLFESGFNAGFVVDRIEEPRFPEPEKPKASVSWHDMPDIPPIMVVRMRLPTADRQHPAPPSTANR
jgi:SAM-dependent methyltransferase